MANFFINSWRKGNTIVFAYSFELRHHIPYIPQCSVMHFNRIHAVSACSTKDVAHMNRQAVVVCMFFTFLFVSLLNVCRRR